MGYVAHITLLDKLLKCCFGVFLMTDQRLDSLPLLARISLDYFKRALEQTQFGSITLFPLQPLNLICA